MDLMISDRSEGHCREDEIASKDELTFLQGGKDVQLTCSYTFPFFELHFLQKI